MVVPRFVAIVGDMGDAIHLQEKEKYFAQDGGKTQHENAFFKYKI